MAVYVDSVRHPFRGMIMCHMWADSIEELLEMADKISVRRTHLQKPPEASWVHFDISVTKKALAIKAGAILTDKYGPVLHVARLKGDQAKIDQVLSIRKKWIDMNSDI